jgi:uncharacterized protein (TIGR02266 family)
MADPLFRNADRRKDVRVGAKLEIRFSAAKQAAKALNAYSVNFSAGGLCLRTKSPHAVGDRLALSLDIEGERFELKGAVMWVKGEVIGVRFEDVGGKDRDRLETVARMLATKNPLVP